MVSTSFWDDIKVHYDMSADDKLLFVFLLTNPQTSVTGVYEIDKRYMADLTGMSQERVCASLDKLCGLGVVDYDDDTCEVLIRNWPGHNWSSSGKLAAAVESAVRGIKSQRFASYIAREHERVFGSDALAGYGVENEQERKPVKHRHGKYGNVMLTDDELEKLKSEFPGDWQERIERLSEYIESKGARYKSHLATIRSWARRDEKKGKEATGEYGGWNAEAFD